MNFYKVYGDVVNPYFATEGSACFDIKAYVSESITYYDQNNIKNYFSPKDRTIYLLPNHRYMIPTGLIFNIPDNHVLKIFVRSSIALKKGLVLSNSVGIIDSDYVDPLFILLTNTTNETVTIEHDERIAQGLLEPVLQYNLKEQYTIPPTKTDRKGGFGSTGR